jgi:hypothetical protein
MNRAFLLCALPFGCSVSAPKVDPTAKPEGCTASLCDRAHASCTPPVCEDTCKKCGDECLSLPIEYGPECLDACYRGCSTGSSCPNTCESDLTACRRTTENAVCADDIVFDPPADQPPCGGTFGAAICRYRDQNDALMKANAACTKCNDAYVDRCMRAACASELDAYGRAAADKGCEDDACAAARAPEELKALQVCVLRASADPANPGNCYAGTRACWGEDPFCDDEKQVLAGG